MSVLLLASLAFAVIHVVKYYRQGWRPSMADVFWLISLVLLMLAVGIRYGAIPSSMNPANVVA